MHNQCGLTKSNMLQLLKSTSSESIEHMYNQS